MRWVLVWSFYDDVIVLLLLSKWRKLEKLRKFIIFVVLVFVMKELFFRVLFLGFEMVEGIVVVIVWIE